ncbi:MAG: hypothetical protein ACK4KW_12450 [Gemmobacter sp.]
MAREREVGTLWIGGALSWLEQLCLKSFVDRGQRITLFSYDPIPNVPDGVIRRDGREVLDTDDFIKYESKDSYALFADLFRLHMLAVCPGMIWVDTDVYCQRPLDHEGDHVMAFELPGQHRVNNAVLGLPADGALLRALIDFTADRFAIPPFLKPALRHEYAAARSAGTPVHVSRQPWGVWGPLMLTHFVHQLGLADQVLPMETFYPVPFPDRLQFLRPAGRVAPRIGPATTGLHLWASNKREIGLKHAGLAPPGSYLAMLCERHGIRPELAPIRSRGRRSFDAALADRLDVTEVDRFADVGGNAPGLALALSARWDCRITLIDLDDRGRVPDPPSDWVAPYRARLLAHGVPEDRIVLVKDLADLPPQDVVANLAGFGDARKIKHLAPVLEKIFHSGSRMVLDIRKGSGAFPFLRERGEVETLETRSDGGVEIARALFRPLAPAPRQASAPASAEWSAIAGGLAGRDGFFREGDEGHSFLYIPRGRTLVVTFDNLDIAMGKREDRRPWGFSFIEQQGWSMLGVMAGGWTWYRNPWVATEFDRLRDSGFFGRFDRVVFYGASMGGYAAAAFCPACPGADVVAISPQSTLDRRLVPWESRYRTAWGRDFSGPYGDAAAVSAAARRVLLFYDPYEDLDAAHADRFTGANVTKLRAPLLGHRLGSSLQQMGILSPIVTAALEGHLTEADFYRALRARKAFPRYQRELFARALPRHPKLARQMGRWVLERGDNRQIRLALESL